MGIAFFPKHSPNTIPEIIVDNVSAVQNGVDYIFQTIANGAIWPKKYQQEYAKKIRNQSTEKCIKRKDEFRRICMEQFVVDENYKEQKEDDLNVDVVKNAINGIFSSIKFPDYWPDEARKAMTKQIESYDIEQVIEYLVNGCAKGGHHGLGKTSNEEREEVIAAI